MWDYYLGGTDNLEIDRTAARIVLSTAPDVPLAALENREFLKHAVRFLSRERGITQFIDIGSGLPTQGNLHQLARDHTPGARVVYVDNDPIVLAIGRARLDGVPGVTLIDGDLREPDAILENSRLRRIIDFSEPIALCMTLVLHFIPEQEDPYGIVSRLQSSLPPRSYVVISHATTESHDGDTLWQITGSGNQSSTLLVMRSRDNIARFFDGLELVEPGVVYLSQWQPTTSFYAGGGTHWAYAGVGQKRGPDRGQL
jgi:hypothetical protein